MSAHKNPVAGTRHLPAMFAFFLFFCVLAPVSAGAADLKGSKDSPLLPRYEGSSIVTYSQKEYDSLVVPLGKTVYQDEKYKFTKSDTVEGRVTRILYLAPAGRSALEVFRNYEQVLKNKGYVPLFSCAKGECGPYDSFAETLYGRAHLGAPHTAGSPNRQGFDFFYGYNCQRIAHTYYPTHLWRNGRREWLANDTVPPHTGFDPGADPLDPSSYEKFKLADYAPDLMFREVLAFIDSCAGKPFFLYWATPIPHVALQAPDEWVEKYRTKFGEEELYDGSDGYFPSRYPHATYAAMISYLDDQIGMMISRLKELGIYKNTVIIFTSDNGPASTAGSDPDWFGSAEPFRGSRGFGKGSLNEGGIRIPLIVSWPGVTEPGTVTDHISAFQDILPTLSEIGGSERPEGTDGLSFLPVLRGDRQKQHEYLYWEFPEYGGQQAVLIGNYKAVRKAMHSGNEIFELYDLQNDPRETGDISADHPEIIEQVRKIILSEHKVSPNPRWRYKLMGE
mgnify:CR=1 FL=1